MKRTEFNIEISAENVLESLGVTRQSELYEEMQEELSELLLGAYEKIKPVALLEFGNLKEHSVMRNGRRMTEVLYGLCSIGHEMSSWSTQLFAEGDYVKGMLVDAIADDYLFQMDRKLEGTVIELCKNKKKGIAGRIEAPKDIPMSIQKEAFLAVHAEKEGISIKESYMYDPVKTLCLIYLLDEKETRFSPGHDCAHCENLACKKRQGKQVSVTVCTENEERIIQAKKSETLLSALWQSEIFLPAICAGRGTCGKCKVRVEVGAEEPSEEERKYFSQEELDAGWRLACCMRVTKDTRIILKTEEEEMYVVADGQSDADSKGTENGRYGIAVDIGTTTIAMQLIELETRQIIDTYTAINRQRTFGADVISRIDASNHGKREVLRQTIQKSLAEGIRELIKQVSVPAEQVIIAANTTMVHLLMGYSCETLGVYPFTPVNIQTIETTLKELLRTEEISDCPVVVLPGISTYVGGDIISGLFALEFDKRKEISVLIDLGTNGEMAIGNQERILVTSTAAGPAFEGGNIVCGTGSIPGAICHVAMDADLHVETETIGGKPPVGICGTGVIESTCELLRTERIDETGRLDEEYFEEGFPLTEDEKIRIYQKDVREIQLAKSAIRAGLETLIRKYQVSCEDIDQIYIAGGFGYKLDIEKAVQIGLLPEECKEKITAVGNSSLQGAKKSLETDDAKARWESLVRHSEEIELASSKEFQELYMEHMLFPEE